MISRMNSSSKGKKDIDYISDSKSYVIIRELEC